MYQNYTVAGRRISNRVYIRMDGATSSPMYTEREQDQIFGWFRNQYNIDGWTVCKMDAYDVEWMEQTGFGDAVGGKFDINGIYRIFSSHGMSIAWFNFDTGTVRFFDNETYERTDKPAFERGVKFTKFFVDFDIVQAWW